MTSLFTGKVELASDGSVLGTMDATQGWKLYNRSTQLNAFGYGRVIGGGNPLLSFRAEVSGFLGGMVAIHTVLGQRAASDQPPSPLSLEVLLGNKALITRITVWATQGPSATLAPDYDLLKAAMDIAAKHHLTIMPCHVKSHQDSEMAYNHLPWQTKLNSDVDKQACLPGTSEYGQP